MVSTAIVSLGVLNIPSSPIIIVELLSPTDSGGIVLEVEGAVPVARVVLELVSGLVTELAGEIGIDGEAFVLIAADEVMDTVAEEAGLAEHPKAEAIKARLIICKPTFLTNIKYPSYGYQNIISG